MSRIRANTIVNGAGTGAPNFPRGAIISGISTINAEISVGTGTSISSPATNELALGTNNVERLRITSAGDAIFKGKVTLGEDYIGGEVFRLGKSSGSSYSAYHTGGTAHGFIGYADQLVTAGGATDFAIRSTNNLVFATNGANERLRISSGGIVTIPNQPAFHTSGNSNSLVNSTYTVIIGNTINVNVGNCYSSSTGRFTAPVDGVYHFSFWGLIYPHPSDVMTVTYYKNGAQWADLIQGGADSNSHTSRAGSVIMSMSQNDYAELRINRGTGTEEAYATQWNMCGFLIG